MKTVAIVGRPNVGKSTLFNRLTRSSSAIVADHPGVTRDRIYGSVHRGESEGYLLIDTGGFENNDLKYQPFKGNEVWDQTLVAIGESDLVIFLVDVTAGVHPHDHEILNCLRASEKQVFLVINKVDNDRLQGETFDFSSLGFDEFCAVSSTNGRGIRSLAETIWQKLGPTNYKSNKDTWARVAIVGRPNAGKSSVINRLLGEERVIASEVAGTTRDSTDSFLRFEGKNLVLVDTAGIRRKTKISDHLEVASVSRSLRAVYRSDVVVFVMDAMQGLADQDVKIINLALDRGVPVLIVVNKWDLIPDKGPNSARDYASTINDKLKTAHHIPVHFTSCETNQRVQGILPWVVTLRSEATKKVPTSWINKLLGEITAHHVPPLMRNRLRRIKMYFAVQTQVAPPTIEITCNAPHEVPLAYERYLQKRFKNDLGLKNVPIRLFFKAKKSQVAEFDA